MTLSIISKVPDLKNKSYLELGTYDNHHFNAIQAKSKTSVDRDHPADHRMSTDDFFIGLTNKTWDVIYIDADHHYESILKDFNNSVQRLNPNGCIFLHDLYPQEAWLTRPEHCGTGYIFLDALRNLGYPNTYTCDSFYGLTVVLNPKKEVPTIALDRNLDYESFIRKQYPVITPSQMTTVIEEYYE